MVTYQHSCVDCGRITLATSQDINHPTHDWTRCETCRHVHDDKLVATFIEMVENGVHRLRGAERQRLGRFIERLAEGDDLTEPEKGDMQRLLAIVAGRTRRRWTGKPGPTEFKRQEHAQ